MKNNLWIHFKGSLSRINEIINDPRFFSRRDFSESSFEEISSVFKKLSDGQCKIIVMPVLLERKKLILDKIRLHVDGMKGMEVLQEVLDKINENLSEEEGQRNLARDLNRISNYISETQEFKEQENDLINTQNSELKNSQLEMMKLRMELDERRSKVIHSFLERRSAATIIGSVLLVVIVFAYISSMFLEVEIPGKFDSAFLIILGYFFGQSTIGNSSSSDN